MKPNMDMSHIHLPPAKPKLQGYVPLVLVISGIIIATLVTNAFTGYSLSNFLGDSMGYFFLVFGFFKVIDIKNFAMGYAEYDLITKNLPPWGYIYPFVELSLGGLYLLGHPSQTTLLITIVLSLFTVVSVSIKLSKHETIHCVCLGNLLKVPLTYVSLVEYAIMGLMALVMLFV